MLKLETASEFLKPPPPPPEARYTALAPAEDDVTISMSQDCHCSSSPPCLLYLLPLAPPWHPQAKWEPRLHSPWMLSIWPSLSAAPRTLHSVLTMRSAFASDRKGLESSTAFFPVRQEGQQIFRVQEE